MACKNNRGPYRLGTGPEKVLGFSPRILQRAQGRLCAGGEPYPRVAGLNIRRTLRLRPQKLLKPSIRQYGKVLGINIIIAIQVSYNSSAFVKPFVGHDIEVCIINHAVVAQVGSGLTRQQREDLLAELVKAPKPQELVGCPSGSICRLPGWRCRVRYFGLTEMGHLRMPSFEGLV